LQAMVETIIIIIMHLNQVIHLSQVIHPNLVILLNLVTQLVREFILLSHIPKLEYPLECLECLKLILPLECLECLRLILPLECLAIHLSRIPLLHQHLELVLALVRVESLLTLLLLLKVTLNLLRSTALHAMEREGLDLLVLAGQEMFTTNLHALCAMDLDSIMEAQLVQAAAAKVDQEHLVLALDMMCTTDALAMHATDYSISPQEHSLERVDPAKDMEEPVHLDLAHPHLFILKALVTRARAKASFEMK